MDFIVKQLVPPTIEAPDFYLNLLKDDSCEWNNEENSSHPYADDITNNDIVYSITDKKQNEDYGYFFFKKEQFGDIIKYFFEKTVLDQNLHESVILRYIRELIVSLNNGNYLTPNRLFLKPNTKESMPLSINHLDKTIMETSGYINNLFKMERDKMVPIPEELKEQLRKQAEKYNRVNNS